MPVLAITDTGTGELELLKVPPPVGLKIAVNRIAFLVDGFQLQLTEPPDVGNAIHAPIFLLFA